MGVDRTTGEALSTNGVDKKIYSKKWGRRLFVNALPEHGKECWKMRNEVIHGESQKDG